MADRCLNLTGTAPGRFLTHRLGLRRPVPLRRWSAERPSLNGPLLRLIAGTSTRNGLDDVLARTGLRPAARTPGSERPVAVALDTTGVGELSEVHATLHPVARFVADGGRIVVLGSPLSDTDHHQAAVRQGLEGFVPSLGKEPGRGRTAMLVRTDDVAPTASTWRFPLSPRSAYVSGQVIEITDAPEPDTMDTAVEPVTADACGQSLLGARR